ncbi:MAG: integrase [Paracoccaceae bacterium]|jgi:integrase
MPKKALEMTALDVRRLETPGLHAVGGVAGLVLQIIDSGARSWILRVRIGSKRRMIGLGGFPDVPLTAAREKARETREAIAQGIDPVEQRKAAKAALAAAQRRGMTFADAVDGCLADKLDGFRKDRDRRQWRSQLDNHAMPEIGKMLVDDIDVQDVLRVLKPIWATKTVTATRLRERIEGVLSWATVAGHRSGDNPARWKGNLAELLPKPSKVSGARHHPAVALKDAAPWSADLRKRGGIAARAVEFLALTAARSGEVRGMTWAEVDLDGRLWTVPADRMKGAREHRVPLTDDAAALLRSLPRMAESAFVFAAPRGGALSDMSLSAVMRRMQKSEVDAGRIGWLDASSGRPAVPHGLRSTFRDWTAERTDYPREMAEIALAHVVGSEVERSYRRGDMVEKRRAMMAAWGRFLRGEARAKVVTLTEARA